MSAVTKCDACGRVDKNEHTYKIAVSKNSSKNGEIIVSTRKHADLCDECRKSLLGFLYKDEAEVPKC